MPKQRPDVYSHKAQHTLGQQDRVRTDASKEFVARLTRYGGRLSTVNVPTAVQKVVDGILPKPHFDHHNRFAILMKKENEQRRDRYRIRLTKDVETMIEHILTMEKRWFDNVCKAHESADECFDDNQKLFQERAKLASDFAPATRKLERLSEQRKVVEGWGAGRARFINLQRLDKSIKATLPRIDAPKDAFGAGYFDGLRLYLRGAGFVVAPSYLPPAAVFPREDWIALGFEETPSYAELAKLADTLMQKYRLLGSPYAGLLYNTVNPGSQSKCGCICVSWVLGVSVTDGQRVVVPVLGMSGGAPNHSNTDGIEAMLGACALPPYASMRCEPNQQAPALGKFDIDALKPSHPAEKVLNKYYDDIMARANNLALNYRVREGLKLRLPSRQAMLSYLGLSFFVASPAQLTEHGTLVKPTPGVTRWHSLNCAEPAALAWITSFFVDGQDVHLCCPYEGTDDPGALGLKPKETCPWCATVEIAYRSLKSVSSGAQQEWSRAYERSMASGDWGREITSATTFEQRSMDMSWRKDLPRNKAKFALAYPAAVNNNVAVLREIFREVGILNESTIRVGRPALWQA